MSDLKEHLDALIKSPGWLLLKEYAAKEWGPAGCWRKAKALSETGTADPVKVAHIDYANQAIGELMGWPEHQLRMIAEKKAREEAPLSLGRGGQG